MITNYRSRDFRKKQIIDVFRVQAKGGWPKWFTMYRIAKIIGMRPSTHLSGIIKEMVDEKTLKVKRTSNPGRWDSHFYALNSGVAQGHMSERAIPIKAAGHEIGQLTMWS
jgi:hypothetical protein